MSYCLNPDCQKPHNPAPARFCQACGARLLLKERYRAVKPLGQGGFGRTFLAVDEDKPSKPRCVIKQFLPEVRGASGLKKAAQLFEQEAMRLEELGKHSQIPELLAHFTQDQQQYLVQEFIEGKNLAQAVQDGVFGEERVRGVLLSVLPVLEFIHDRRVIHRDIKPENIIVRTVKRQRGNPRQPNWAQVEHALTVEAEQGYKDWVIQQHPFSELVGNFLAKPPKGLSPMLLDRWHDLTEQFSSYAYLTFVERKQLVAEIHRLIHNGQQSLESQHTEQVEELVLVDFGAAKRATVSGLMKTGTTIGSPEYLAPEQARGKAVFASDLYSLGVTCLHLLTGISPFDLYDTHEDAWVWRRYLNQNPVGDNLGQILDRLVQQATGRRFASASEVLTALNSPKAPAAPAKVSPVPSPPPQSSPKPKPGTAIASPKTSTRTAVRTRMQSWRCMRRIPGGGKVYPIVLTPDNQVVIGGSGTSVQLWEVETGQPLGKLLGHFDVVQALALSPDGTLLASGGFDKSIRLWQLPTGQRLGMLTLHTDTVLALAFSPGGQLLVSSSIHDPIVLWDVNRGQERNTLVGHGGRVDALAFSGDGTTIASGSADLTIRLWDGGTGAPLHTLMGHTQPISAVAFSPDGSTLASSSWDGTVRLWSLRTRKEKRSLGIHGARVNACVFSPDGKLLATGGDRIQLWSPRTGKEIATLVGHSSAVLSLAFSADGNLLASSSLDGTIVLWEQTS